MDVALDGTSEGAIDRDGGEDDLGDVLLEGCWLGGELMDGEKEGEMLRLGTELMDGAVEGADVG